MDFEEYVSANYKRLEGQTRELVEDAFKAGQQSKQAEIDKRFSGYQLEVSQVGQACVKWKEIAEGKQAEIDALKAKVQELWTELDERQSKEHIIERCESIIKELLK